MHLTNYAINKLKEPILSAISTRIEGGKNAECSQAAGVISSLNTTTATVHPEADTPLAVSTGTHTSSLDGQSTVTGSMSKESHDASKMRWRCKQSLNSLLSTNPTNCGPWSHFDSKRLWAQIDEIVRNTIFALSPYLKVSYWAMFGHPAKPVQYSKVDENAPQDPHSFQVSLNSCCLIFYVVHPTFTDLIIRFHAHS